MKFLTAALLLVFVAVSTGAFEITSDGVYPRVITPNGDGCNDRLIIRFSNPYDNEITAKIFTLNGCELATLPVSSTEDYFYWDGRDSRGETAQAGAYVFQVRGEGQVYNGMVVVAR